MRCALLLSFSLAFGSEPLWIEGIAMEMPWRICVAEKKEDTEAIISRVFEEIYATFSLKNAHSTLSQLNAAPLNKPFPITPELYELLDLSKKIHALTDGRFDPTCGHIKKSWIEALESKKMPLKQICGLKYISFDERTLTKKAPIHLDLNGSAKGYCVDQLFEALAKAGYTNFFVEWSGEMRTRGRHPEGRPWTILIPGQKKTPFPLSDLAVASSGDYLQNWRGSGIEKETLYTHIVEPKNGALMQVRPGGIAAATVVAKTCALADALATSAMLFDETSDLKKWIESVQKTYPETLFWILRREQI